LARAFCGDMKTAGSGGSGDSVGARMGDMRGVADRMHDDCLDILLDLSEEATVEWRMMTATRSWMRRPSVACPPTVHYE
jgi:hypothetical protein